MKRFQKRVENFVCKNCNKDVVGTGYTDHCPRCLYSVHVDINPGDRKASCGGLMKPVAIKKKGEKYIICYLCLKCDYKYEVKMAKDDNLEEIILFSTNIINDDRKGKTKEKNKRTT